jgi:hypothetical protein
LANIAEWLAQFVSIRHVDEAIAGNIDNAAGLIAAHHEWLHVS